ncbi:integrase [Microbacterium trichothecenolyticum]|uniref:tyrosine-type recombinase/integrase n=1 Tax=Microbacterium trichothecenolyticum TaxID=69370 RepID=UPI0028623AA0|nr:tyrosine-type recombinase/integrase [Microbacterium trichothecenolyticum]MDR7185501.1 integrase [Microbacterium trichothecenolyticum]
MGSVHPYTTAAGAKRYRISYRRPDHKQTTERGFKTKRDAELRLAEVELSKSRGEYVDPATARATVADLGREWLAHREGILKPSSYRPLQSAWGKHVEPKWGSRSVGSIRHSEVQAWVSGMQGGSTTVRRAHGILAGILDIAVNDRRLARNVARDVDLPKKTKSAPRHYLTHAQVQLLADHAREPTLVLFLAYTGLRWGEATALRVRHVDALRRRVNVEENAVLVSFEVHVGTPKTHRTRSVPYPEFLALPLARLAEGKGRDALFFGGGTQHIRLPASRNGWFTAAVLAAQADDPTFPRVTPHDLRHTAASLAVQAGAHVKAVQRMLGHASAAMTLDVYADLFDDDLDAVASALDRAKRATDAVKVLPRERDREF